MKPKSGGAGQSEPPQVALRPAYEDFRPVFERQREEEAEKLLIYLPGFPKENIRVSTEGKNTVRIREHLVAVNKWNRFQEDFPTPEDYNMTGISARFENGILTITMPTKKFVPYEAKGTQKTPIPPNETRGASPPITTSKSTREGHNKPTLQKPPIQCDSPPKVTSPIHTESHEKYNNSYEDKAKQKEQGDGQITSSTSIYRQVVKSLTKPNEKRQLLMNAGVAVLVIVALGAYFSLQYRGSLG